MERVLLIGPGGSGKSTLAQRLADATGLPLVHLDALYWRSGWVETPRPEWLGTIGRLVREPRWIIDGNYGGTLDLRLAACDTIVLMDLPPWVCVWRVLARRLRHAGRTRPDMAPGCPERVDAKFLWWIATYRAKRLPGLLRKLAGEPFAAKRVVVLRSASEAERFLSEVAGNPTGTSTG